MNSVSHPLDYIANIKLSEIFVTFSYGFPRLMSRVSSVFVKRDWTQADTVLQSLHTYGILRTAGLDPQCTHMIN